MTDTQSDQIVLPHQLISSVDLARLTRELVALDESLRQAELRTPGQSTHLSRSSQTLEELAKANHVHLTDQAQRTQLIELLRAFEAHAPRIHMGLATEPTSAFTRKIVIWMRANIHPLVLLEVGLQPTIAAGCTIRTTNKMFDMSLRNHFAQNRELLIQKITEIGQKAEDKKIADEIAVAEGTQS